MLLLCTAVITLLLQIGHLWGMIDMIVPETLHSSTLVQVCGLAYYATDMCVYTICTVCAALSALTMLHVIYNYILTM
jgi:hypothetical protein